MRIANSLAVSSGATDFVVFGPFRRGQTITELFVGLSEIVSGEDVEVAYAMSSIGTVGSDAEFGAGRSFVQGTGTVPTLTLFAGTQGSQHVLPVWHVVMEPELYLAFRITAGMQDITGYVAVGLCG